jgi:hypothetical protein
MFKQIHSITRRKYFTWFYITKDSVMSLSDEIIGKSRFLGLGE